MAEVVSVMQAYNLVRDDWDTVNELAHYSSTADPTNQIASKVVHIYSTHNYVDTKPYHAQDQYGTEPGSPLLTILTALKQPFILFTLGPTTVQVWCGLVQ